MMIGTKHGTVQNTTHIYFPSPQDSDRNNKVSSTKPIKGSWMIKEQDVF